MMGVGRDVCKGGILLLSLFTPFSNMYLVHILYHNLYRNGSVGLQVIISKS